MGRCLQFDRFTLDVARAALRFDNQELFPRKKAFEVLLQLAESARQVVRKEDIFQRAWPGVAVTDDTLVQCVRELRKMLGDKQHQLIRTVNRRGYLLDAEVTTVTSSSLSSESTRPAGSAGAYAIASTVIPAPLPASALNRLFTADDARQIALIAREKELPIPRIEIDTPDDDVPPSIRRFVGVWVSTRGFVNTNRQFMLIVGHVEKEGLAGGWTVRGPPAPNSRIQHPAGAVAISAYIAGDVMTYSNPMGSYKVWFVDGNSLIWQQTYVTSDVTMVALRPVWTLSEAERASMKDAG
jgi:DNA-binding winged helix-turn-helix (wHTH) protein